MNKRILIPLIVTGTLALLSGCKNTPSTPTEKFTMRVGYFPNITHSQALIGMARGDFQKALGSDVTLTTTVFNAGPSVIEALFAGQIDLSYIGPNPAINGYTQSEGKALRVVAGATSGGAALVVRPAANIKSAADLAGKKLATPQLGNTQDVALRGYLAEHGLKTKELGGDVEIIPTDNAQILDLFRLGKIDGAWVPEPWASRLVVDGGGTVFIDERDLWTETGGEFTTAVIIVDTKFLAAHPDAVKAWLRAHVEITQWELENPGDAQTLMNAQIEKLTGKKLSSEVLVMAWSRMKPTWDPITASITKSALSAFEAGFLKAKPNLDGLPDLTVLNQVLKEKGLPPVK
jgi:NitT/TauT family transport system substrate-binding protein